MTWLMIFDNFQTENRNHYEQKWMMTNGRIKAWRPILFWIRQLDVPASQS